MDIYSTTDIAQLKSILDTHGIAILTNHFTINYADNIYSSIKQWLIDLDIGLTNDPKSWTYENMPLGARFGMYQSIVSNAPAFWTVRESLYPIFQQILNEQSLLTSIDGASIYPTMNAPKKERQWAHIDQTNTSEFVSYQSQFVATDTSACFLCTPTSHLKHKMLIDEFKVMSRGAVNWHKFNGSQVRRLKEIFGGLYQIPIVVPKGSVIFWDSRLIHSAKYSNKPDEWRCSLYVSMRPRDECDDVSKENILKAAIKGGTTNHLGSFIFEPVDRYGKKNPKLVNLMEHPECLSYVDNFSDIQKRMVGL